MIAAADTGVVRVHTWKTMVAGAAVVLAAVGCGSDGVTVLSDAPDGPAPSDTDDVVVGPQVPGCEPVDDERDTAAFANAWLGEEAVQDAWDVLDDELLAVDTLVGTYVHYASESVHVVVGSDTPEPDDLQRDLRGSVGSELNVDVIVSCRAAAELQTSLERVTELWADLPGSKGQSVDPTTSRLHVSLPAEAAHGVDVISEAVPLAEVRIISD